LEAAAAIAPPVIRQRLEDNGCKQFDAIFAKNLLQIAEHRGFAASRITQKQIIRTTLTIHQASAEHPCANQSK
jgi:hypothetical protein